MMAPTVVQENMEDTEELQQSKFRGHIGEETVIKEQEPWGCNLCETGNQYA